MPTRLLVFAAISLGPLCAQVLTSQYNNARTSAVLTETILTPANVNPSGFGKVFSFKVDGDVYAQPLYVPRVDMPGKGVHNVVFIATEHDSVYAFDAEGKPPEPLWQTSFLKEGATTVPSRDVGCAFIAPEVGITPTPVIDLASGTLYVLARTKENGKYVQRLHALVITTGAEKLGGPVEVEASVAGTGAGSSNGRVPFDALRELPRAGLLLTGNQVYLTWASSCDVKPYHGWIMAYDARTLKQTAVFNTSPDGNESGIWQSDMAPVADDAGNVYVATGNGTFTAQSGGRDYGDSLLKLHLDGTNLAVRDRFTPPNHEILNSRDLDLGSGGPILFPAGQGRNLLAIAGKAGPLHILDPEKLNKGALQALPLGRGFYAAPAYWNGHLFVVASDDNLKDFTVANGQFSERPAATGEHFFPNPGANLAVSANGARNAIVWLIETKVWNDYSSKKRSILRAYDAINITHELYTSEMNPDRDRSGSAVRFTVPTIANGRVYIGVKGQVDVYGLLPSNPK